MPSSDYAEFRSTFRKSKHIVAITGAGLSAGSGIPTFKGGEELSQNRMGYVAPHTLAIDPNSGLLGPTMASAAPWKPYGGATPKPFAIDPNSGILKPTFRGPSSLWRSFSPRSLATPQAFAADPNTVWQFYHMRREKALKATPNNAHFALAALSIPEQIRTIAPHATFTHITQNVDGLCVRAIEAVHSENEIQSGVFEMHGSLFSTICIVCNRREANFDSPICPSLAGTERIVKRQEQGPQIPGKNLPRCSSCDGLLRPGVVWFGEIPHHLIEIKQLVEQADLGLVIGSSSTVYPAAGFALDIAEGGGKIAVFNIQRSEKDTEADFLFLGACEKTLPFALFGPGISKEFGLGSKCHRDNH